MGVVEVDQVLQGLGIARTGEGLEIARDVVLELAQQRGELRIVGWVDRDVCGIDDRGARSRSFAIVASMMASTSGLMPKLPARQTPIRAPSSASALRKDV